MQGLVDLLMSSRVVGRPSFDEVTGAMLPGGMPAEQCSDDQQLGETLLGRVVPHSADLSEQEKQAMSNALVQMARLHEHLTRCARVPRLRLMLLAAQPYESHSTHVALHSNRSQATLTYLSKHVLGNVPAPLHKFWLPQHIEWWHDMVAHGLCSFNRSPLRIAPSAEQACSLLSREFRQQVFEPQLLAQARLCDCVLVIGSASTDIVPALETCCSCVVKCSQPVAEKNSWAMPLEAMLCLIDCLKSYAASR